MSHVNVHKIVINAMHSAKGFCLFGRDLVLKLPFRSKYPHHYKSPRIIQRMILAFLDRKLIY